jgi:hypothetical protein
VTRSPWLIQTGYFEPTVQKPSKSGLFLQDLDIGAAEFAVMAALDLAAELVAERLLAVADGEDRHAGIDDRLRGARAALVRHRGRTAGKDHRFRFQALKALFGGLERHDFGIDAGLAHAARDQLGHLAAEVDDEDGVGMNGAA